MSKQHKLIYWSSTILLCTGMCFGGIAQVFRVKETVEGIAHVGYPPYFMSIIGLWKIAGVIVVLMPKLPLVKEWAYAGFFFAMTGAVISHIAIGDRLSEFLAPLIFTLLAVVSWYFRPPNKKLVPETF
jgi:hypothetical protein